MLQKILFILAYPFIVLYLVISFPFKVASILMKDKKNKPSKKRKIKMETDVNYLQIGQWLFPDCQSEFREFYHLYRTDKHEFSSKYHLTLDTSNDEDEKTMNVLYAFGEYKRKIGFIDWKGEENNGEIEEFIESQIDKIINWENTKSFRSLALENNPDDGKYIIKLLQAINKDLQHLHYNLLFFNMGWDEYVYISMKNTLSDKIIKNAPDDFQYVDDL